MPEESNLPTDKGLDIEGTGNRNDAEDLLGELLGRPDNAVDAKDAANSSLSVSLV